MVNVVKATEVTIPVRSEPLPIKLVALTLPVTVIPVPRVSNFLLAVPPVICYKLTEPPDNNS